MNRYAIIGNPVAHSQSPWIHTQFAQQTGETMTYEYLLAPLDGFAAAVHSFGAAGGCGLNVTTPFKLEAYRLAHTLAPRAADAGAVNTLKFGPDGLFGDNTDGVGLVRDLEQNLAVVLSGRRILLLGAGGAARGVILPLLQCAPSELVIVNRSADRAAELVATFSDAARAARCALTGGASEVARGRFDVVINATASSLDHQLPSFDVAALGESTLAYDMMYAAQPTVFMQHAAQYGARVSDGLGMLVEQAAEAFYVWRGIRPDSAAVLTELRAKLRN